MPPSRLWWPSTQEEKDGRASGGKAPRERAAAERLALGPGGGEHWCSLAQLRDVCALRGAEVQEGPKLREVPPSSALAGHCVKGWEANRRGKKARKEKRCGLKYQSVGQSGGEECYHHHLFARTVFSWHP